MFHCFFVGFRYLQFNSPSLICSLSSSHLFVSPFCASAIASSSSCWIVSEGRRGNYVSRRWEAACDISLLRYRRCGVVVFFFLETCFSGFINLSLFLALHVSKPSACISRMARIHTFKMSGLKQTGQMWGCESETLLHNSDVLKCKVRITQGHCF